MAHRFPIPRVRLSPLGLLVAALLCGCLELSGGTSPPDEDDGCGVEAGLRVVEGEWTLSGGGRRVACADPLLNGNFEFRKLSLAVGQANDVLRLTRAVPVREGDFQLRGGRVRGSCVDFQFMEIDARGAIIEYTFHGNVTDSGRIVGEFEGTGPAACRTSGHFAVSLSD